MAIGRTTSMASTSRFNVRTRAGWTFQGGTSTGQGSGDNCAVRANLPELSANLIQGLPGITTSPVNTLNPYCKVDYGWLTQFRALSSYVIPKIDVQFSGVFQSKPGADPCRQLGRSELARRLGSRAGACRKPRQRDDQPPCTGRDVRRPAQPARFPRWQDFQVRRARVRWSAPISTTR